MSKYRVNTSCTVFYDSAWHYAGEVMEIPDADAAILAKRGLLSPVETAQINKPKTNVVEFPLPKPEE